MARAGVGAHSQGGDPGNERTLDRITAQLNRASLDPHQSVRLAPLCLARAGLMSILAYEREHPDADRWVEQKDGDPEEYTVWCRRYLAADPDHVVTDALHITRLALRQRLTREKRYKLLLNAAVALCYLGRHRDELVVLHQAKPLAARPEVVMALLTRAYEEAGEYRQARAARRAWHQLLQPPSPPPPLPVLPVMQRSGAAAVPSADGG